MNKQIPQFIEIMPEQVSDKANIRFQISITGHFDLNENILMYQNSKSFSASDFQGIKMFKSRGNYIYWPDHSAWFTVLDS